VITSKRLFQKLFQPQGNVWRRAAFSGFNGEIGFICNFNSGVKKWLSRNIVSKMSGLYLENQKKQFIPYLAKIRPDPW
jgi:hypothetical protein